MSVSVIIILSQATIEHYLLLFRKRNEYIELRYFLSKLSLSVHPSPSYYLNFIYRYYSITIECINYTELKSIFW